MAALKPQAHSSSHAPGTNMAALKPRAHSSHHALGNNMADCEPWAHSSHHVPRTNVAGRSFGLTAPDTPREPTWPTISSGSRVPAMPWDPTWPSGRFEDHSYRYGPGTKMDAVSPRPTAPAMP